MYIFFRVQKSKTCDNPTKDLAAYLLHRAKKKIPNFYNGTP